MKKFFILMSIALLSALVLVACAKKDNTLRVGMELAYPPFETKDDAGKASGVSVDLASALGEYLKRPVEISNIEWAGLIPAVQTGKVDLVISSMSITEDRKKTVAFSDPYGQVVLAILANKKSGLSSDPASFTAKKDLTFAIKNGTSSHNYVKTNFPNAKITLLADESACVTEVIQGKADAFVYDQLTIYRNQQKNPDTTLIIFLPNQQPDQLGIAIKKDNTELLGKVNAFLADFKAKNGFKPLTDKYLSKEYATFKSFGLPWFFEIKE